MNATYMDIIGPQAQLSCIKEFASPDHLARIKRDMASNNDKLSRIHEVQVPVKPLTRWLLDYNLRKVDFFSLDVEGAEVLVLKTIDFDIIDINVITVEVNGKLEQIKTFLENKGFVLHRLLVLDAIFCRRQFCRNLRMTT